MTKRQRKPDAAVVRRVVGKRAPTRTQVKCDYLKSGLFRVVHADGFHGGLTPSAKVHLAVFNERKPIARSETYAVTKDGALGEMKTRMERDAIVREVEVSIVMDLDKAIALRGWLDSIFKQYQELQARHRRKRKRPFSIACANPEDSLQ